MQVQVDIEFNDLFRIVKNLPDKQLSRLKREIEKEAPKPATKREDFRTLLLSGPTFSKKQLDTIAGTRKAINQWRTK